MTFAPPLLILSAAFLFACTGVQRSVQDDTRFGGPEVGDTLFFSMERTPCFGQCPAFRVNIYRSGYATYEGMSNVERIGTYRTRFSPTTMGELLNEAERIGYFTLEETYDGPVTDLPAMHLRMVSGSRDKSVMARYKVPQTVKEFGSYADELVNSAHWEKTGQQ